MIRISTNIPACISGAADCVLKLSASIEPQQAASVPMPMHDHERDRQPAEAREVDAEREADDEQHGGGDQRPQAGRDHEAGEQHRPRGGGDEQAVEPALLDVAGQVDAGRRAGEAGALQQADRDHEALVAVGGEARQRGQAAEHARSARGRRSSARARPGSRRPGRAAARSPPGGRAPEHLSRRASPGRARRSARSRIAGTQPPSLRRRRSASALSTRLIAPIPAIDASALADRLGARASRSPGRGRPRR